MSATVPRLLSAVLLATFVDMQRAAPAVAEWRVYRSAEGAFSAAFPARPRITRRPLKGNSVEIVYRLNREPLGYRIGSQSVGSAWRRPGFRNSVFGAVRRNLMAKGNYRLLSQRPVTAGTVRGRALVFRIQAPTIVILEIRMFLVRDRFYQIIFASSETLRNHPSGFRFLSSFRITYR